MKRGLLDPYLIVESVKLVGLGGGEFVVCMGGGSERTPADIIWLTILRRFVMGWHDGGI